MQVSIAKGTLTVVLMSLFALLGTACGEEGASGNEANAGGDYSYDQWDADDNDELSQVEFNEGVYESWDTDDSGVVEEDEFDTGVDTVYSDYDESAYGGFDEWDADNNDELSQNEFDDSVADTGLYDEWDADDNDQIDEDEFNEATSEI